MAEILSVEVSSFFQESGDIKDKMVFPATEASEIKFPDLPEGSINRKLMTPLDFNPKTEPYLIEIPPKTNLHSHFLSIKGKRWVICFPENYN